MPAIMFEWAQGHGHLKPTYFVFGECSYWPRTVGAQNMKLHPQNAHKNEIQINFVYYLMR